MSIIAANWDAAFIAADIIGGKVEFRPESGMIRVTRVEG